MNRLCGIALRFASHLAPHDVRAEWLREWRAEIAHAEWRAARAGGRTGTLPLVIKVFGAPVHAVWLRWDRWRPEMLWQDVSHAVRGLLKRPGFATITILTLAIGIGANTAIFGAVRAVLVRPLPFPESGRLVSVFTTDVKQPDRVGGTSSPADFTDFRAQHQSFTDLAAIVAGSSALSGLGPAEQIPNASVTGAFFQVLQVPPLHGRTLLPDDDATGTPEVVVLSHAIWSRRFGRDPAAVGRTITLDGVVHRIVGVMPEGFAYPFDAELWTPLRFDTDDLTTQRGAQYLDVIGRLRPEATVGSADVDLSGIASRLAEAYPRSNQSKAVSVYPMRDALVGNVRPALLMLLAAAGTVLLIVCVNVASLVLTRSMARSRELAVKTALGAGRGRLVAGMLAESLVLAAAGGAAGLALAFWLSQAIAALDDSARIPLLDQTRVDTTVVLFTMGVSLAAALLFGTLPAWLASALKDVAQRMREDSTTSTGERSRQRLRAAFVVAQAGLAVALLVGAGLLMRSFANLTAVDLGFDGTRVQTFSLSLPDGKYPDARARAALVESLVERVSAHPDVEGAAAIFGLPLTRFAYYISMVSLDGRTLPSEEGSARSLQVRVVTPDYFRVMGIRLARGRAFAKSDAATAERVVIVNEQAAAMLWPGEDPLGHSFVLGTRMGQGQERAGGTVVGVAGDVRDYGAVGPVRPTVYLQHAQTPTGFVTVAVKTRRDPSVIIEPARASLAELDADMPMFRVRSMEQISSSAVAQPRLYMRLLGLFAAAAIVLAAIGIYGVLSHTVSQRRREIGIRMALGAERSQVVGMVVGEAGRLAALGLAAGLVLAAMAGRVLEGLLFGIAPLDTVTYALAAAALLAVSLAAAWVPARRAAHVDPVKALKYE